ncbi:MAG: glycosyltransferase family 9 protein, partial [Acidobacteriaceae bacterium]|nr:glycosyltransferase family 9 protein [Acidobacteriaceae bacterium]
MQSSKRKRVLIVRIGAMGDVLHAMPAVAALGLAHPEWEIGWVVEPRWLPLLRSADEPRGPRMPLVDHVYLAATKAWKKQPLSGRTLADIRSLARSLRDARFDLCVDLQGSIRSAVIGRMAGAMRLAGPAKPRETPARWLYREKIATHATHVVEQGGELLSVAVGENLLPAKVVFPEDEAAEAACDHLLDQALGEQKRFVLMAPSAGWGAKRWPAERYGEVAKHLAEAGFGVLVNASVADNNLALRVVEASGNRASVVPTSLAELIALTRRAALVIAGDTGPLHLAAALERPVVAIFGPTDPARNGPYAT